MDASTDQGGPELESHVWRIYLPRLAGVATVRAILYYGVPAAPCLAFVG
jgi:hypothetical protein